MDKLTKDCGHTPAMLCECAPPKGDKVRLVVEHNEKEIGALTLTPSVAKELLEGEDIVAVLGGYDAARAFFTRASVKAKPVNLTDKVNHPEHYTAGRVECIDALEAATVELSGIEAVCTANAIKYLWRWKRKGGHEDLRKARWYINRLLGD